MMVDVDKYFVWIPNGNSANKIKENLDNVVKIAPLKGF